MVQFLDTLLRPIFILTYDDCDVVHDNYKDVDSNRIDDDHEIIKHPASRWIT